MSGDKSDGSSEVYLLIVWVHLKVFLIVYQFELLKLFTKILRKKNTILVVYGVKTQSSIRSILI